MRQVCFYSIFNNETKGGDNVNTLFIGRSNYLKMLRENVFYPPDKHYGDCLSVCGPHGIGKTYLLDYLRNEFEHNKAIKDRSKIKCFYLEITNNSEKNLYDFQSDLIAMFRDAIDEEDLENCLENISKTSFDYRDAQKAISKLKEAYALPDMQPNKGAEGYDSWCAKINRSVQSTGSASVFYNYTLLGFRIILIFDEFDRAATGYPSGDIFMWLFSLSNKSSTGIHINTSIVLLSRQRVNIIAHHMEDGSNFEDAYPVFPLTGFNNKELDIYFDSFHEFDDNDVSDTHKKQILYLCGRHPGLLMKMRKFLSQIQYSNWDINEVWLRNPGQFKTVYEKMCKQLQAQEVSKRKTLMDIVLYQFEFFSAEDGIYDELLRDSGFATSLSDDDVIIDTNTGVHYYKDIFVLSGEKALEDSIERLKREPLSPYFLDYIRLIWKPDQQRGVADYLEMTERLFRVFIKEKLKTKYPTTWKIVAESALPNNVKKRYYEKLKRTADLNGYTEELSILDVMCFDNYYDYNYYFSGYYLIHNYLTFALYNVL